jgi:hypothetical protein
VGRRQGHRGGVRAAPDLRRRRRREAPRRPPPPRRPGAGRRRRAGRRHPHPAGAVHPRRRHPRLQLLPGRLRGAHPQGAHRPGHARRLRGRHHDPHQPGHPRHRPLRPPPHARPGRHRRRRGDGLPGRVPGGRPPPPRPARHLQGADPHQHLRPPGDPGRGVGPVPQAGPRAAAGRRRLLPRRLRLGRGPLRAREVAPGREPRRRPERRGSGQTSPRPGPHQHVPGAGPPHRRPRPAALEGAPDPSRARPRHLRAHDLGPGAGVLHRRAGGPRLHDPGRAPRRAARRLLPAGRGRVHAHPGARPEALDPGARRRGAHLAHDRRAAPHPRPPERGRGLRALPPHQVRGPQALRARGGGERHPPHRRGPRPGRPGGLRRGRAGHGPPGPAERAGQHRRQVAAPDLPRVRGRPRSGHHPGLGRRQVPPGRVGEVRRALGPGAAGDPGLQPVAPRGRRSRRRGDGAGQAGPHRPARVLQRAAAGDPRRRRLLGSGGRGRDAQPVLAARLPGRGHDPPRRQQPGGLHDVGPGCPLVGLRHRRGQDGPGADLPRERRRPRGVRAGGPPGLRVPAGVPQGRRHRHGLLPAARPQRGRRSLLHPAPDVQADRTAALGAQALHRGPGTPGRHHPDRRREGPRRLRGPHAGGLRGDAGLDAARPDGAPPRLARGSRGRCSSGW